ncbi:MAG: GNAT family N-acetyltransferase [Candidatus Micrarchaeota archaeon]|nr:GNAT family N-acetyltransferase [Candidatus Micrarchaeota archaeon]
MLTFQTEKWSEIVSEMQTMFEAHYKELALDQDRIALAPNTEMYEEADRRGLMHLATVREDGKLVGYFVSAVLPHLHYKNAGPMSQTDAYFVLPEYRKGGCGAKFLMFVEESLRNRGVTKMYVSTKLHSDHSVLFEKLGFRATDTVFTKMLR